MATFPAKLPALCLVVLDRGANCSLLTAAGASNPYNGERPVAFSEDGTEYQRLRGCACAGLVLPN